jgi:hypothetical protein
LELSLTRVIGADLEIGVPWSGIGYPDDCY